jgi:hypothetical protein
VGFKPAPRIVKGAGRLVGVWKFQLAHAPLENAMRPRSHQQFLLTARTAPAASLIAHESVQRALRENIVIASDMHGGHIHALEAARACQKAS